MSTWDSMSDAEREACRDAGRVPIAVQLEELREAADDERRSERETPPAASSSGS